MRYLLAIAFALGSSTAHADGDSFLLVGTGAAYATNDPGYVARVELGLDANRTDEDEDQGLFGVRLGFELWSADGHAGFAMPLGFYLGAQVKGMRTALGGGLGLFTFEHTDNVHFGLAPFASGMIEVVSGKTVVSIGPRVSRQVLIEGADYNVYSVMLSVGKRYEH